MPDLTCAIWPVRDVAEASWIIDDTQDWKKLATQGPSGLARHDLLDLLQPSRHQDGIRNPDAEVIRMAVTGLLEGAPDGGLGHAMFWTGWGEEHFLTQERTPIVSIPHRDYYLYRVELGMYSSGLADEEWLSSTGTHMPPPAFVWPDSKSWCLTYDVDMDWATMGYR